MKTLFRSQDLRDHIESNMESNNEAQTKSLRRVFETSAKKSNESVKDFLARVSTVTSHMKSYAEQISNETMVAKVLRSLTP
ncbi:hypothetical protein Tco_0094204, partial [Tanacetum coccineum]